MATSMLTISSSQIDTYEDCNRFWWFTRVLKLSEPPQSHFTFGTILHGVCERWMMADEQGRVPEGLGECEPEEGGYVYLKGVFKGQRIGAPVELYPEGWTIAREHDGSTAEVTPNEARQIKNLVSEAIEKGILFRQPGTTCERRIDYKLLDGVKLVGYIDVFRQGSKDEWPSIEDHKSYGKSSVRFLKTGKLDSPNYLGKNQQVRTYATITSKLDGHDGDVVVYHNQFPKFPGRGVERVRASILPSEQEEHWEYLLDVAQRMLRTHDIKKWQDVPGPKDTGKCARWFGKPCPFADICGNVETVQAYQERTARLIANRGASPRLNVPLAAPRKRAGTNRQEATTVSLWDKAKAKKDARAGRQEAAAPTTAPKTEVKKETPAAPPVNGAKPAEKATVLNGAPWARPSCPACKGRGMNSKGLPCSICDKKNKQEGKLTSAAYVVEIGEDGLAVALARDEHTAAIEAAGLPLEWVEEAAPAAPAAPAKAEPKPEPAKAPAKAQEPAKPKPTPKPEPKPAPAPAAEEPAPEAQEEEAPAEPEQQAETSPRGRKQAGPGRPKVGLGILIGAVQLRGPSRPTVLAQEVLARFGAELAKDMGASSYFELDPFKRRERIAQKAAYIAEQLGRSVMLVPNLSDPDISWMVSALAGLPEGVEFVIEGLR